MTQASMFSTLGQTRLVGLLKQLMNSSVDVNHARFGERLGQLVDLSDSFALSDAHYRVSKQTKSGDAAPSDAILANLMDSRRQIVTALMSSFAPDSKARFKFPDPANQGGVEALDTFAPFRRFYLVQQRELESRVQALRVTFRAAIRAIDDELAKLAALDEAMAETLLAQTHKLFVVIPGLLEQRFVQLKAEAVSPEPTAWLGLLSQEMQAVLLAELECRLLPVIGMAEAVTERLKHEEHTNE